MTRAIGVLVLVAALVGGCGAEETRKPTFGGGSASSGASADQLAALKSDAKIADCPASTAKPPSRDALPDLRLDCLGGGRPVRLSGLAGTPTVINLWASWCTECREELPLLARADREYGDRVRFIGIDIKDSAPESALRLAEHSGVTYAQLVDLDGRTQAPLRYSGLPQTVLVDAQGRMVFTERTPFRSYADVTAAIRRHLGVSP